MTRYTIYYEHFLSKVDFEIPNKSIKRAISYTLGSGSLSIDEIQNVVVCDRNQVSDVAYLVCTTLSGGYITRPGLSVRLSANLPVASSVLELINKYKVVL